VKKLRCECLVLLPVVFLISLHLSSIFANFIKQRGAWKQNPLRAGVVYVLELRLLPLVILRLQLLLYLHQLLLEVRLVDHRGGLVSAGFKRLLLDDPVVDEVEVKTLSNERFSEHLNNLLIVRALLEFELS